MLTLGSAIVPRGSPDPGVTVVRLKAASDRAEAPERRDDRPREDEAAEARPAARPSSEPPPSPSVEPLRPDLPPPPLIRLSRSDMAAADIAAKPSRPAASGPKMGPPDTGSAYADSARVSGAGPNGEPLYAAAWYREPYDDELRGYLSTASGPGWGLIACRTAPDYRVEDCVKIDEWPTGSNIARSVLAAAWQFRVRPPRIGGEPRIGEWVRIRIDYDLKRR